MEEAINKENKGTTVLLKQDAYLLVRKRQMETLNRNGKDTNIQDIVSDSVKKGLKVDELDETYLKNLIYRDVIQILEPLEHSEKYKGNSHHLTQEIVEKLSSDIIEVIR